MTERLSIIIMMDTNNKLCSDPVYPTNLQLALTK